MSISFLSALTQSGVKGAIRGLTNELVRRAPNTSIEAGQMVQEGDLDDAGEIITRTRHQVDEAQTQFDNLNAQYQQHMGAADVLQTKIAGFQAIIDDPNKSDAEKADAHTKLTAHNTSLNNLLAKIEAEVPDLEHYRTQLVETQQFLAEAEAAYHDKAGNLVKSGEEGEQAKRDLARARLAADQAKQREEDARKLAGLSTSSPGINPAVEALKRAAQEAKDEAAKSTLKANTLRHTVNHGEDDPIVAAALAEAKGTTSPQTVAERLAALKQRAAA